MAVRLGQPRGTLRNVAEDSVSYPHENLPEQVSQLPSPLESALAGFSLESEIATGMRLMPHLQALPEAKRGQLWHMPFEELVGTGLEHHLDWFYDVNSEEQFQHKKRYLMDEMQRRQDAGANFWSGLGGGIVGGVLSPTNLIGPGMAYRTSASALRGMAVGARTSVLGVGLQEGMLYAMQDTRTGEEVAAGIAAGTFIGTTLGGVAGNLSKRSYRRFVEVVKDTMDLGDRMIVHDPRTGKFFGYTPEALSVFERRMNEAWARRAGPITQAEKLDILREFGEEFDTMEAGLTARRTDDGAVILETDALSALELAITPWRVGMSVEEEALAQIDNIPARWRAAEGGQAQEGLIDQQAAIPIVPSTGPIGEVNRIVLQVLRTAGNEGVDEIEVLIRMRQGALEEYAQLTQPRAVVPDRTDAAVDPARVELDEQLAVVQRDVEELESRIAELSDEEIAAERGVLRERLEDITRAQARLSDADDTVDTGRVVPTNDRGVPYLNPRDRARAIFLSRAIREVGEYIDASLDRIREIANDLPGDRAQLVRLQQQDRAAVNLGFPRRITAMIHRAQEIVGSGPDRRLLGLLEPIEEGMPFYTPTGVEYIVRFGSTGAARLRGLTIEITEEGVLPEGAVPIGARVLHDTNEIVIDTRRVLEMWRERAWTRPALEGVEPLPDNTFATLPEWQRFVVEHEIMHVENPRLPDESVAAYENRMNQAALGNMQGSDLPAQASVAAENLLRFADELRMREMQRLSDLEVEPSTPLRRAEPIPEGTLLDDLTDEQIEALTEEAVQAAEPLRRSAADVPVRFGQRLFDEGAADPAVSFARELGIPNPEEFVALSRRVRGAERLPGQRVRDPDTGRMLNQRELSELLEDAGEDPLGSEFSRRRYSPEEIEEFDRLISEIGRLREEHGISDDILFLLDIWRWERSGLRRSAGEVPVRQAEGAEVARPREPRPTDAEVAVDPLDRLGRLYSEEEGGDAIGQLQRNFERQDADGAVDGRDRLARVENAERLANDIRAALLERTHRQGALEQSIREIEEIDSLVSLIRPGDDLSGLDSLKIRQAAAFQRVILGDVAALEQDIARDVAALRAIEFENSLVEELTGEGVARDLRQLNELPGIDIRIKNSAAEFGIETVEELIAHLMSGQRIRGIGPSKQADILDNFIEYTNMATERANALRDSIEGMGEGLDQIKPPSSWEGGNVETITVRGAPLKSEKLQMLVGTAESTILQRSPIRAHKQILIRLMDTNVILVENDTGQIINPNNVRTGIAQANSLAVSALRRGPRQQWANYLRDLGPGHKDQSGTLGNILERLTNRQADLRAAGVTENDFYDLIGDAMHNPSSIEAMNPLVAPYVRAAARTMREGYYLPMLHLWEQNFGATPKVAADSYLMRLYDMQKILGHEDEFHSAVFEDMVGKLRQRYREDAGRFEFQPLGQLEVFLSKTIKKWIEAIGTEPGGRMPPTWGEHVSTVGGPGGRPGRARKAFDWRDIEPEYETIRPYLNRNIQEVTAVYSRTRVPDIMLSAKFGDVHLEEALEAGQLELAQLIQKAEETITDPIARQAAIDQLQAGAARDVVALRKLVEVIRGTFLKPLNPHSVPGRVARLGNAMKGWTYGRVGGGFAPTALGDIGSTVATNGASRSFSVFMESFRARLLDDLPHVADRDLQNLIVDLEDMLYSRVASFTDYDPHGPSPSKLEQLIQSGSRAMANVSLLLPWTNLIKGVGARGTIRKIAELSRDFVGGTIEPNDLALLRRSSGMSDSELRMIHELWREHGHGYDGGPVALGTELWPDGTEILKSKVQRLVIADSDRTAPTPRPGDRPFAFHTRVGSLLFQFKGFGFAFSNKLFIPLLQGMSAGDMMIMTQMGFGISLASMIFMLKSFADKREIPTDIGYIIQQGVVRADTWGKFQTIDEFSSTFTPFPSMLGLAGPDTFYGYDSRPWVERAAKTIGGPNIDTVTTAVKAGMALGDLAFDGDSNQPATREQYRALRKVWWFQNLFYMDWLWDVFENGLESKRSRRAVGEEIPPVLEAMQ